MWRRARRRKKKKRKISKAIENNEHVLHSLQLDSKYKAQTALNYFLVSKRVVLVSYRVRNIAQADHTEWRISHRHHMTQPSHYKFRFFFHLLWLTILQEYETYQFVAQHHSHDASQETVQIFIFTFLLAHCNFSASLNRAARHLKCFNI